MARVKLGLVGCGGISQSHVNGYRFLWEGGCREFEVTACCDPLEAAAEKRAGQIAEFQGTKPKVFTDPDRLLGSGLIEAADLCLPHHLHHSMGIQFLNGGCHVMIEKPLGLTVKATRKLIAAAGKNKKVLATAENIRRYLAARAMKWALIEKQVIGDVRSVLVQHLAHGPFDYELPMFKWRGVKLLVGGGMIMDSGAHFTDMMLHLFGDVDEVFCTMNAFDNRVIKDAPMLGNVPADVEDSWHAVIRFQTGLTATWTYSRTFTDPAVSNGLYYGSEGTVKDNSFVFHCFQVGGDVIRPDGGITTAREIQVDYLLSLAPEAKARLFPYGCTDGFAVEVWDFIDSVRNKRQPEMDGEEGLRAKALCEACYESATLGRPVKYADVLNGTIETYQKPINDYWKI